MVRLNFVIYLKFKIFFIYWSVINVLEILINSVVMLNRNKFYLYNELFIYKFI